MKKIVNFSHMPIRIAISEVRYKHLHYHPDVLETMFVLEGSLTLTIDQKAVSLQSGDFAILPPNVLHCVYAERSCTLVSIYFDLNYYVRQFPYIKSVPFVSCRASLPEDQWVYADELRNYFIRMMLMYNKSTPPAQRIMENIAVKMLQTIWLHFQDRKEFSPPNLERYYSISLFLQEHFMESITVSEVARHENISATRLAHFWKDAAGISIRQSITRLRLGEAEKLLLESALTINEIAYRCGFSDEKYFYQHFKSHFGATPNEYRQRNSDHQSPSVRVLLSKREGEQRIAAFAMKYYEPDAPASIPTLTQEEKEKEATLQHLYNAILKNTLIFVEQFSKTGQDTSFLQVTPGKALVKLEGVYEINWEYVYAQIHISMEFGLTTNMLIDFDCMPLEELRPLLLLLIDEIRNIWGKSVVEAQKYLIFSKMILVYHECLDLASLLREQTPVQYAQAMYML